jgi:hypothetical protein
MIGRLGRPAVMPPAREPSKKPGGLEANFDQWLVSPLATGDVSAVVSQVEPGPEDEAPIPMPYPETRTHANATVDDVALETSAQALQAPAAPNMPSPIGFDRPTPLSLTSSHIGTTPPQSIDVRVIGVDSAWTLDVCVADGLQPQFDIAGLDRMTELPRSDTQSVPIFEFHFQEHHGKAVVVSVPWRLSANTRLSQYSRVLLGDAGISLSQALAREHSVHSSHAGPSPLAGQPITQALASMAEESLPVVPKSMVVDQTVVAAKIGESHLVPASVSTQMAAPWTARLIRWLERQGLAPAVWIRDYALDAAAAQQVATLVHALAQEQGIRLERIVVNARELWRAPTQPALREFR